MTLFDGSDFARGWLSVALASSKDDDRPALHRTVLIESFSEGVRLVATDSYVLLRAWVANVDHWGHPEPGLDEQPMSATVAIDDHSRARGLMAHALSLANQAEKAEDEPVVIRLRCGVVDLVEDSARPAFDGLQAAFVTMEVPDKERLRLATYEGEFPTWRRVVAGFMPGPSDVMALMPDVLGQVAKLGSYHGGPLGWEWSGADGPARLRCLASEPPVEGLVMPARWDFDRDEPRIDLPPPPPDEDDDTVDELLAPAGDVVVAEQLGSITLLRRRLNIGSRRAADLLDELQRRGLVGPALKGRPRPVLVEALDSADLAALTMPTEMPSDDDDLETKP